MRICFIAKADSVHTQDWVNFFAQKGHEVHLISTTGWELFLFYKGYHASVKFHLLHTPIWWSTLFIPACINYLSWIIQTRRWIKQIKPDIIDAHYISLYGYLAVATGFHPLTLTAWGSDILIDAKGRLHRFLCKYALKKADKVICDSETLKKELLTLGTNPDKINIIYNGVDTEKFSPLRLRRIDD